MTPLYDTRKPDLTLCHYKRCQGQALQIVSGQEIYPHRPDLAHLKFWRCPSCRAYVGCHGNTDRPLGIAASEALRQRRISTHAAFDPIWKSGNQSRNSAYRWLAQEMGIPHKLCHISWFNSQQCHKAIAACNKRRNTDDTTGTSD